MFRHHHHTSTGIALALALAALAPTAASAASAASPYQAQGARVAHEFAARDAALGNGPVLPAQIIKISQPNGFDWGDAGIGAAGGLALSTVGLGGALVISSQRRTRRSTAPPASTA